MKSYAKPELKSIILKASSASMIIKVASLGLSFILAAILSRTIGVEGYGIYSFAFAVVSLLAVPTQLGLPDLLMRQVAWYKASGEWGLLKGVIARSNQLVISIALLVSLSGLFFFIIARPEKFDAHFWAIPVSLLLIPFLSLSGLRMAVLRGLRRTIIGQLPEEIIRPTIMILMLSVSVILMGREWLDPTKALSMAVGAAVVAFFSGAAMLFFSLPQQAKSAHSEYRNKEWLSASLPFTVMAGTQVINTKSDILLLGVLGGVEDVGLYAVATKMASLVYFARMAIIQVVGPQIAHSWRKGEIGVVDKLVLWAGRMSFCLGVLVAVGYFSYGEVILSSIFGEKFAPAFPALMVLTFAWTFAVFTGIPNSLLKMAGYEKVAMLGMGIAAISNVVLNITLIPIYGLLGAAVATATSVVVQHSYMSYYSFKKTGIDTFSIRLRGGGS